MTTTQIFNYVLGSTRNFLTPNIYSKGKKKGFAYEISWGKGFGIGEMVFGVTLINISLMKNSEFSKGGFSSLQEAQKYLDGFIR